MQSFLENAFMISYVAVVVLSIMKYPKYFDTPLRFLPVVLFFTLLTEVLGGIILENKEWRFFSSELLHYYNMVVYNIYALVFFLYFFYVYWKYLNNNTYKKFVTLGAVLFAAISLANPFFQSFLLSSQTYSYSLGSIVLIGSALLFLREHSRAGNGGLWRYNLMIWISIGLLIFYGAYLPIELYRFSNQVRGVYEPVYVRSIVHSLILLMNLSLCLGFLWMRSKPVHLKE